MGLEQLAFPDVVLSVPLSHLWICWMGSWSRELHQFEANILLGCNKRSHQVTGWNLCPWRNMCVCARTASATFFSMNAVPSTQRKPSSKLTCIIAFFLHWIHQCVCVCVRVHTCPFALTLWVVCGISYWAFSQGKWTGFLRHRWGYVNPNVEQRSLIYSLILLWSSYLVSNFVASIGHYSWTGFPLGRFSTAWQLP